MLISSRDCSLWGDSFAEPNDPKTNFAVPYEAGKLPRQSEPMGATLALLGRLYCRDEVKAVYARGGFADFRSALDSPFCYFPHDAVIPAIVPFGGIERLAVTTQPLRPVRMEAMVDGLNRRVDQKALHRRPCERGGVLSGVTALAGRGTFATPQAAENHITIAWPRKRNRANRWRSPWSAKSMTGKMTSSRSCSTPVQPRLRLLHRQHGGSVYAPSPSPRSSVNGNSQCTGVVLGECSSASILIFAACQKRLVTRYSTLLFHRMRWQSDKRVEAQEAARWAKHFEGDGAQTSTICKHACSAPRRTRCANGLTRASTSAACRSRRPDWRSYSRYNREPRPNLPRPKEICLTGRRSGTNDIG